MKETRSLLLAEFRKFVRDRPPSQDRKAHTDVLRVFLEVLMNAQSTLTVLRGLEHNSSKIRGHCPPERTASQAEHGHLTLLRAHGNEQLRSLARRRSTPRVPERRRRVYLAAKRLVDIPLAAILLIALSPLMVLVAVTVKLTSPGPVLFRQRRLTDSGREFIILKFRTMCDGAEAKTGAVWAVKGDPRVTPVGRFLRKSHLDELPQLFNVLRNDMTFVGPRPERPEFAETLRKDFPSFDRRLAVKAGITGLAQVCAGYASTVEGYRRKLAWDRLYVRRQGPLLDLKIALMTIVVILHGE